MRFEEYINEQGLGVDDFSRKLDMIKRNCAFYLKLLKGKAPLARGMKGRLKANEMGKKQVRQERTPRGMPLKVFTEFNKWLQANGHLRRDNVVIAISDVALAEEFGAAHYIFPIGKFGYSWIRAGDVNLPDQRTGWDPFMADIYFDILGFLEEEIEDPKLREKAKEKKFLPGVLRGAYDAEDWAKFLKFPTYFTTNKGFDEAYRKGYEIWMDCKEYFFVDRDDEVMREFL